MLRGGNPVLHDLLEFLRAHARVRRGDDLEYRFFPAGKRTFYVTFEQLCERLLRFPFGMLRRKRLHAIEREHELEIYRLLASERAVVVERGDALGRRDKIRRAFLRDLGDEFGDGLLGRASVPRGERILGVSGC